MSTYALMNDGGTVKTQNATRTAWTTLGSYPTSATVANFLSTIQQRALLDGESSYISTGTNPEAIWGDATQVYVANEGSNNVTCILRSNNSTTTIAVGSTPKAIWGDSTQVYVANQGSANVTCIKRSDNSTTTITAAGTYPQAIWGDATQVYIGNYISNNVTCILRSNNYTTTIATGTNPYALWGDATQVYVANHDSNNVTCIKRSDNSTTTIVAGTIPITIWGDATQVYVANFHSNSVTCIKRSDNSTTTIAVGTYPQAIWGDSTQLYVANYSSNNVTCIKRSDNSTTTIAAGTTPYAVWGDSTQVYVANQGSNNVTCILRSNNSTTTIAVGATPFAMWGYSTQVYVANSGSANVTVIARSATSVQTISNVTSPACVWGDSNQIYIGGDPWALVLDRSTNTLTTTGVSSGSGGARGFYGVWGDATQVFFTHGINNSPYIIDCLNRSDNSHSSIPVPNGTVSAICGDSNNVYFTYSSTSSNSTIYVINRPSNTLTSFAVSPLQINYLWCNSTNLFIGGDNLVIIDRSTNTVSAIRSKLVATVRADSFWGDSASVYIADYYNYYVTCINLSDNSVVNISIPTSPGPIWGDSTAIYVISGVKLYVINRSTNAIVSTITLPYTGNEITGTSTQVYCTSTSSNTVFMINRANNSFTAIPTGTSPMSIVGDSNNMYVTNATSNSITIIPPATQGLLPITESALITSLTSTTPQLLLYTDTMPLTPSCKVTGVPAPQLVLQNYDLDLSNFLKIDSLILTSSTSNNGVVGIIFSGDSGVTWNSLVNGIVTSVNTSSMSDVASKILTPLQVNSLVPSQLSLLFPSTTARFGFYLFTPTTTDTVSITDLSMIYDSIPPSSLNNLAIQTTINGVITSPYGAYTSARTFNVDIPIASLTVGVNTVSLTAANLAGNNGSTSVVITKEAPLRLVVNRTFTSVDGGYTESNVNTTSNVASINTQFTGTTINLGSNEYSVAIPTTMSTVGVS